MVEHERGTDWMTAAGEPILYVGLITSVIKLLGGGDPNSPVNLVSLEVAAPITTLTGAAMWFIGAKVRIPLGKIIFGS